VPCNGGEKDTDVKPTSYTKIVGVMSLIFKPLLVANGIRPLVTRSDMSNMQYFKKKERT
jgi:hypothetical protein